MDTSEKDNKDSKKGHVVCRSHADKRQLSEHLNIENIHML